MSLEYTDPGVEQMYKNLSKMDIHSLTPEETSATWEIIKKLYKDEQKRRRRTNLIRVAAALSTTLLISSAWLLLARRQSKNTDE